MNFGVQPVAFTAASQKIIPILTDRPADVGADLVAAAIATRELVGAPSIAINFGTATTYGIVDADGAYAGVAIAPGIQVSLDALVGRTAKLPQVALQAPGVIIGRDTVTSIQAGIVYGAIGAAEAIVARIRAEIGAGARVIASGGLASVVAGETPVIERVVPHLVLFGLRSYHQSLTSTS
jgi:type III pantothenate kinase